MKRVLMTGLIAGAVMGGVDEVKALGQGAQQQVKVLSKRWFIKMDQDHDGKVSKKEYIDCGSACLKKEGKQADRAHMEAKFARFDRDGDGFISGSDPVQKNEPESKPLHKGNISVTSAVEKDSDHEKKEQEKENSRTGKIIVTTTTTRIDSQTPTLTVTVFNTTSHPDTYSLEWYYLARRSEGDDIVMHDSGCEELTVDPLTRIKHTLSIRTLEMKKETVQRGFKDPTVSKSGQKSAGYVILLKCGDVILDKEASSEKYLSKQWIDKLASGTT